jgi:hypothetical protein
LLGLNRPDPKMQWVAKKRGRSSGYERIFVIGSKIGTMEREQSRMGGTGWRGSEKAEWRGGVQGDYFFLHESTCSPLRML